jgi:tellurite resistance protein
MAFNMDDFKKGVAKFADSATKKIKQYTPESFSKEKKLVNAIVASLALMVVADRKVETSEVVDSIKLINDIDEISDLQMQKEAIEFFEIHIENLTPIMTNEVKWAIEVGKIITDIARIKEYPDYIAMIEVLLDHIANSDGNFAPEEREMKDKILSALK